ncbi:hypothetical protein SEPL_440 [Salmonella phage SE_PL]|uniref:hypothetical protein n=1 Tax=Salmonella enterica TaxID=28901 RepID=UPI000FDF9FAD|nr:hypothetical protein CPT_Munch_529 [Salmonella phage Munch]EAR2661138.1 hypothetical protein [Salmonella enterica]ECV9083925.1 hypothetical protein [Salmonella enterica subsp. enterica serovar Infantis]MCP0435474.1 hypothetical protein [Salmonella enterica subsp. enterica serovar Mbandaka]QCW18636.1 hypothetical protein 7t3_0115 [Salmonella phage 7t3]QIG63053.1 hypothetical protein SEPL_440 [Salmonella phage SE_PL]WNV47610.1 hypothetical protein [Klebsiella phage fENko-Kae01]
MITLNVILALLGAVFLVVGWYSIWKETVFTDFFEFYIEKNNIWAVVLQSFNHSLILIGYACGILRETTGETLLLLAYLVLSLVLMLGTAFFFAPGRFKKLKGKQK